MQRSRDEFLARARFARSRAPKGLERESRPIARKHFLHGRRLAQDSGNRGGAGSTRPAAPDRGAPHERDRFVDVKGLWQVFERAAAIGGDRVIETACAVITITGSSACCRADLSSLRPSVPGMRTSVISTSGRRSASATSAAPHHRKTWTPCGPAQARSTTERIDASSSTTETSVVCPCAILHRSTAKRRCVRPAVEFDDPAVARRDVLGNGETEPGAARARGHERIENRRHRVPVACRARCPRTGATTTRWRSAQIVAFMRARLRSISCPARRAPGPRRADRHRLHDQVAVEPVGAGDSDRSRARSRLPRALFGGQAGRRDG